MIEAGFTRIFRTIPLMLIVVFFCPFAYDKVIYVDNDAVGAMSLKCKHSLIILLLDLMTAKKEVLRQAPRRESRMTEKPFGSVAEQSHL